MCTLLLLRHPAPGWRLVFLENRDHPGDPVQGDEARRFGPVVGHHDFRSGGLVCGYNEETGLAAGLANVPGPKGPRSRGEAMRRLLTEARNAEHGVTLLGALLGGGEFSPAAYVLGDAVQTFRVENLQSQVEVAPQPDRAWTTNHFRLIPGWIELVSSVQRAERVREILEEPELTPERSRLAAADPDGPGALCRLGEEGVTLSSFMAAVPDSGPPRYWFAAGPPSRVPFEEWLEP